MADAPKGSKFDFQKIISDVKSMIGPTPIPDANKDDPIPYLLSELGKQGKELTEMHQKQSDIMAKMNDTIGSLYSQIMVSCGESVSNANPAPAAVAPASKEVPASKKEEPKPEVKTEAKPEENAGE